MERRVHLLLATFGVFIALSLVLVVNANTTVNQVGNAIATNPIQTTQEPLYLDFEVYEDFEFSELSWESNADMCYATGSWAGEQPPQGVDFVVPSELQTYTLECVRNSDASRVQESVDVYPVVDYYYDEETGEIIFLD